MSCSRKGFKANNDREAKYYPWFYMDACVICYETQKDNRNKTYCLFYPFLVGIYIFDTAPLFHSSQAAHWLGSSVLTLLVWRTIYTLQLLTRGKSEKGAGMAKLDNFNMKVHYSNNSVWMAIPNQKLIHPISTILCNMQLQIYTSKSVRLQWTKPQRIVPLILVTMT